MAALTQLRPHGAFTGQRFTSFAGRVPPLPRPAGKLTQNAGFGAGAMRRYGSFARGVSNEFNIVQGNQVNMFGSITAATSIQYLLGFEMEAPLAVNTIAGTIGVSGDIQFSTSFNIAQGGTRVGLNGSMAVASALQTTINVNPQPLALSGSLTLAGDTGTTAGPSFDVAQSGPALGLFGAISVTGDIVELIEFNIDPSTIGLSGTVGVAGELQLGTLFNVVQSGNVGMAGTVQLSGSVNYETPFDIGSATASLSGALSVSGNVVSSSAVFGAGDIYMSVEPEDNTIVVPPHRNTMTVR